MPSILTGEIINFLEKQEFINVSTCDFSGRPNVAPKFLVKIKGTFLYLIDYVEGRTFSNLKVNPKVSLSTVNMDTLIGYQINGVAKILDKGGEYEKALDEAHRKQVHFSALRLIEGIHREKKSKNFEVVFPENGVIFKIKVEEVVEIGTSGNLKRINERSGS